MRGPPTRKAIVMLDARARTEPDPVPRQQRANPNGGEMEDGLGLAAAWAALRRRKWVFLAFALLVPLAALVALERVTPRYTATGALIYEPSEYKLRELQSILRVDPTTEAVMASQAEILQSLHIAQRVAERGNLYNSPEFNPALRPVGLAARVRRALGRLLGLETPAAPPPIDAAGPALDDARNATMLAVQAALHATAIKFSRVIEVSFTAEDRVVAAQAVNNAMDVYIKDQYAAKQRAVRRATEWLEKRAAELRAEVRAAEHQIAAYRAARGLSQGMHAGIDAEQISHLSEEVARARGELANAEGRLDAARGRAGAAAQAAIAPSVVQLRAQQDQLAAQLQSQQTRLGARHPEAEGLRQQLAGATRAVAAEVQRVVSATEAEVRAARERVAALEQAMRQAQQEADRSAQAQVPLNAVQRDLEAARGQLQAVLERIQQTSQQAAIETPEAHEISQALPPLSPSWPRKGPMLAGAAAVGVLLGGLAVLLLQRVDPTLSSGATLRQSLGLPCFALLPEIGRRALGALSPEDFVVRRPLSPFAEQIRALRAALFFGAHHPRVIAVTAARPDEAKTVVTLCLARSARMSGERVVAVECDLRAPAFLERLDGDAGPGLAELLRGEATLDDVLRKDSLTGMAYVPAGRLTGDALGLFLSDAMGRMLQTLRQDHDLVLLDLPPAQATAEARVVAGLADATLLCVRWRSTPRHAVTHAIERLQETQASLVGAVLTRVDPRTHARSGQVDAEVYHRRTKRSQRR
ncbi:MAG: polysaccharide biosynthesis tyrosine autokinase [Rhodospirillales bacterium]|nr:polysaccharide biosynthesis tyrosine autokinase [Rhodospirillales bacterium]